MDWMSQDLAARLSARAAQGIGAGLLTARLGIKAMELCRPLPWIDGDKPRLGDFRRELVGQLKDTLNKKHRNSAILAHQHYVDESAHFPLLINDLLIN
jgi:putative membrane protein